MKKPKKSAQREKRSAAKDLPPANAKAIKGGALAVASSLMPNPPPISPVFSPEPPPIKALSPQPPPI